MSLRRKLTGKAVPKSDKRIFFLEIALRECKVGPSKKSKGEVVHLILPVGRVFSARKEISSTNRKDGIKTLKNIAGETLENLIKEIGGKK